MTMPIWWTRRQPGERTNLYLARVLDAADLPQLADSARMYHYDDYFCPEEVDDGMNIHRLIEDIRKRPYDRNSEAIIQAAMDGEFDGTREEADQWAGSPNGKRALGDLTGILDEVAAEGRSIIENDAIQAEHREDR